MEQLAVYSVAVAVMMIDPLALGAALLVALAGRKLHIAAQAALAAILAGGIAAAIYSRDTPGGMIGTEMRVLLFMVATALLTLIMAGIVRAVSGPRSA